ncbi:MAG: Uma2 family endonuclease, partial [Cyanobacteria bacterium J06648_11]
MAIAQDYQSTSVESPKYVTVPLDEELYSDEPCLETYQHLQQLVALLTSLEWWWDDRNDFFAAGNLTVYYSQRRRKSEDFRGPDFFVVLDTERRPRKSWTVWQEDGKYPNVIIEVLSDSTAATDRGLKKQIYQDIWRTPNYFWIDPDSLEFVGFHLVDGAYQPLETDADGRMWCQQLELFLGIHESQLRFFTPEGELVPTPKESAVMRETALEREREQAARERQRAEEASQRAEEASQQAREAG